MPIYEFKCTDCEHEFEVLKLSSSDFPNGFSPDCEKCASKHTRRQLSRSSFKLQGDGFYETSKHGKKRDLV